MYSTPKTYSSTLYPTERETPPVLRVCPPRDEVNAEPQPHLPASRTEAEGHLTSDLLRQNYCSLPVEDAHAYKSAEFLRGVNETLS